MNLKTLTIRKAHEAFIRGEHTVTGLARAYLKNIEAKNRELNAYLEVFDDVLEQARRADERIKAGKAGALAGIPFAVKDNILIEGRRAGAASRILEGYRAPYDATAIAKLKAAGAIFLGRTNCDEFAMGSSTENSAYGVTRNPRDSSRVAGGSSGGSAAAVAADMALAALGSDTGGSIRQPAALCGVVGLKPTYGAVSRHGLIALGSSLDCIGPIAKTAEDARTVFNCIAGRDQLDSTSTRTDIPPEPRAEDRAVKIGVPLRFIEREGIDGLVLDNFQRARQRLEEGGAVVEEVSLDALRYALPCYYIIMPAEASANLARYDGMRYGLHRGGETLLDDYHRTRAEGFGAEVRRRILIGTYVLSSGYYDAYYNRAVKVRALIREAFDNLFQYVDVIAMPTAPTAAWKLGEKTDPLSVYLADVFTVTANIAGIPAISLPSGCIDASGAKLTAGLQLMAPRGREDALFELGKRFEAAAAGSGTSARGALQ